MPIFQAYFQPHEGRITMTLYLEFICMFSFFSNKQLLPLILSIVNVFSNKVISELQIYNFFHSIHIDNETLLCVPNLLFREVERENNNLISLVSFCKFLITNEEFLKPLSYVRNSIIEKIITKETYSTILKRKSYFVDQVEKQKKTHETMILLKFPRESCIKHTFRVIFSDKPYEYYYDYIAPNFISNIMENEINDNEHDTVFDEYITVIRKQFGYSNRHTSKSRSQLCKSNNKLLRESGSCTNAKSHFSRLTIDKEKDKFMDRTSLLNVAAVSENCNNIQTVPSPLKTNHISIFANNYAL